ncbi:MAG TPA: hypothetical protein VGK18_17230 [Propionicimonas sp.]|uniref:hypothetical protein n=1 Tax=Propionicimonas sp. TaxID=1955623 RepID=UPI002F3FFBC5
MALVLLRLRLVIAGRSRGQSNGARLYLATTWVVGSIGGLMACMFIATLVSGGGVGDLLMLALFASIFIPWVVGPIVEPTLADGVVDPQRLEQFPLTGWQQVSGLLAGALISPTTTFTFLFAAGGTIAINQSFPARLASLLVAVAFTVMCVAVSRAAQAVLAGALRSRRGADIAAFSASLMVLGIYLFAQQARSASAALGGQSATGPLGTFLGWTPPGAAGEAISSARDGNWLGFLLRLAVILLTTALALTGWVWALGRRVDGVTSAHRKPHRHPTVAMPLSPALLRSLPPGPTSAAAAQQLRYFFFRSPRAIQTLIIPPVMGVVVAHASFADYGLAAQSAAFAAMSVVAGSFNLFGYDGPGFGYLLLGGARMSRVLIGKAMAPLLYLVPLVVVFNLTEALIRGTQGLVVPAILAGTSVVALGVGVGSLSSVFNASDQSRVGQRHGSFLKVFAWFMGFFAFTGFGALVWVLADWAVGSTLTAVGLTVVSIGVSLLLLRWAGRRLERDPYSVLAKLDQRVA